MSRKAKAIDEKLVRAAPKSVTALKALLFDGLDWPKPIFSNLENIPLIDWEPGELHLDEGALAKLSKIQQVPKLTDEQPFGVFILSFEGGRLPIGAVRRVVDRLVHKKRAQKNTPKALWGLSDLLFFCLSDEGVATLHVVAFHDPGEAGKVPVMKVISWSTDATDNRISLVASENLPELVWPSDARDTDAWRATWTGAFTATYRQGVKSSAALAARMADVARTVRDEVSALLVVETDEGPLRRLLAKVRTSLKGDMGEDEFADMYAQTMVYGLLASRITHPEDFDADAVNAVLRFDNEFLDALYASFRGTGDEAFDVDEFGLRDLGELLARTDVDEILADVGTDNHKDDPVVFFYEEFLQRYDPEQKKELGAYYTPIPVVRAMVRAVDDVLKQEFGLALGVADRTSWRQLSRQTGCTIPNGVDPTEPFVRVLDPATGTGTFLLEWLRRARGNLRTAGLDSPVAVESVVRQMDAFEISLSSYSVAHLKTSLEIPVDVRTTARVDIRLADTLAAPSGPQAALFGDDPISREGQAAAEMKFARHHSVVIGNPPYKDKSKGLGPIVEEPMDGRTAPLLDDFTPAKDRGLGAHTKILRNLYVFFWRFALHKALGSPPAVPGVVAFITSSAWLTGPVFETMRAFIRQGHKVWVVDLGGDVKLKVPGDENVFEGVQLATAICIVVRCPVEEIPTDGEIRFRRLAGSRASKLSALAEMSLYDDGWTLLESATTDPIGEASSREWDQFIPLGEAMPFHANGIHQQRTWVNDASREVLRARWKQFAEAQVSQRAVFMKETRSRKVSADGKDLETGGALGRLDGRLSSDPASIVRYSFRTLDRQWLIADSRIIDMPSPELWQVRGDRQVFLNEPHSFAVGAGPAVSVAGHVPNFDHFKGNSGGRTIPVFRDAVNNDLNLLPGMLDLLNTRSLSTIDGETLIAYFVGLAAFPGFSAAFSSDLEQGGVRVPLCIDTDLVAQVADLGSDAVELFTYLERTIGRTGPKRSVRLAGGPRARSAAVTMAVPAKPVYDASAETLQLGELVIEGVHPAVWSYEVSGMQVVKKWLGYRKAKPAAKWGSPLNDIVTTEWPSEWTEELLDLLHVIVQLRALETRHAELLDAVRKGPLLRYSDVVAAKLVPPPKESTKPKKASLLESV